MLFASLLQDMWRVGRTVAELRGNFSRAGSAVVVGILGSRWHCGLDYHHGIGIAK